MSRQITSLKTLSLVPLALAAGLASSASAQTFAITPGGVGFGPAGPVFRYTPAASGAAPSSAALTSATSVHATYSFSRDGIASVNDSLWRAGWFFRVQGGSRELAFVNAASGSSGAISITRTANNTNNLGTLSTAGINYTATSSGPGTPWSFSSLQTWDITNPSSGPLVTMTNTLVNNGETPITINLFWCTDLDTPANFSNDALAVTPNAILQTNLGSNLPTLVTGRGNSTAYAGRGGVGFPFANTVFDDMTDGLVSNFNNTIPADVAGFDRNSGLQWTFTIAPGNTAVATTTLQFQPVPPCGRSDIAGPGQELSFDGQLTADDIIVFLNNFFAGVTSIADVAGPGQNTTALDGELTADDIIVFLNRFFAGC